MLPQYLMPTWQLSLHRHRLLSVITINLPLGNFVGIGGLPDAASVLDANMAIVSASASASVSYHYRLTIGKFCWYWWATRCCLSTWCQHDHHLGIGIGFHKLLNVQSLAFTFRHWCVQCIKLTIYCYNLVKVIKLSLSKMITLSNTLVNDQKSSSAIVAQLEKKLLKNSEK